MPEVANHTALVHAKAPAAENNLTSEQDFMRPEPERDRDLYRGRIQPKLAVGAPDDPFEREADTMADTVMRMPEKNFVQLKCAECEKEDQVQRKPITGSFTPVIQTKPVTETSAPVIQRTLSVPDAVPADLPANDIGRTIPIADKRTHFNNIIQSLCSSFSVDAATGLVSATTNPAPTPATLAAGAHPMGCCGLNILVNGVNDWKIEMSQLEGAHTRDGGSSSSPFTFVLPPPNSAIGFGAFTAAGSRTDLNEVVVAGHEIIGHGAQIELGIHNQGDENRESFNHHDPTIRIQNILAHEQGVPASQDRGLAADGVHRGESFAQVEIDQFAFNSHSIAALPAAEQDKLRLIADFIIENNTWVDIIGHSDPVGSDAAKQQVSQDRADAVKARLIALGVTVRMTKHLPNELRPTYDYIDRPRFTRVAGVSDTQPPATGADDDANWRRVEIFVANHPAGAEVPPADIPALQQATPGANLAAEQASTDPCHRLLANSAFPTSAATPAVPVPATPAVPAPPAPTAAPTAPAPAAPAAPAPVVQPKLSVGAQDSVYEKEADHVADKVMRTPGTMVSDTAGDAVMRGPQKDFIQQKCAHCERGAAKAGSDTPAVSDAVSHSIESSKGGGSSMDDRTTSFMSDRFGADFSDVKIHTGSESAEMNRSLNAKAFTTGRDIYFNEGQYQPGSESGKHLLAHELTHVVQQNAAEPSVQRDTDVPAMQKPTYTALKTVKDLSLTEIREEKGQHMYFNVLFSNGDTQRFYIHWDVGDDTIPVDKEYQIRGGHGTYTITNKQDAVAFSLQLLTTDKFNTTFYSFDLDNAHTDDSDASNVLSDMRLVNQALDQATFPLTVDYMDMTGTAPDKDSKKGVVEKQTVVRKPVFNFKLPTWFQELKIQVEEKVRLDREANKDNPYLPDKMLFYGQDTVQERKGADAWTIQVDKGDRQGFYTILKKQWDDAADKKAFTEATVTILYEKVQGILNRPPEDKPVYEIDGTGKENKFQQNEDKPKANPFSGLKKEELEKLKVILKELTGDTKPDDKTSPPKIPLSPNDIKALLQLADDPYKDKIIAFLKAKTGNGVSTTKTIEELIAQAKLKDAYTRFDIKPDESTERQAPIANRPVHGDIVQHDPLIVAKKTVSYGFEVKDDVDGLRVPWINIRWHTYSDPTSSAPKDWKEDNWNRYIPINDEGIGNSKHFKVDYPAEGVYIVEAIVDHNFFLPSFFRTSVKVLDEVKVVKDKEDKVYKGFLQPGTTSETDFGQLSYGTGTVTKGKLDSEFKGATAAEQLAQIDAEIKRIDTIIEEYKKKANNEGAPMVEWGEKYKAKLQINRDNISKTNDDKDQHLLACRGTYVSRTEGVKTADLKLSCFVKKDTNPIPPKFKGDPGGIEHGYRVTLYDYTQLYENENYVIDAFKTTSEAAMKEAFSKLSEAYPDGHISVAFQKWDDAAGSKTDEYVQYNRVTDTIWKKTKKVLFSTPVNIAVNVVSAVLSVFPPTTALGLTINILYNGAQTVSELQEEAAKGTLTGTKAAIGAGSMLLNVLPILGSAGKAARIVQVGTKAYYVVEGIQLAGQGLLMYEQGMEQVDKLRTDYFVKIAELDDEIADLKSKNESNPKIDELEKQRKNLMDNGRDATMKVFTEMAEQQLAFTVGAKLLHGVHEHYAATTKLEARGKIKDSLTGVEKLNDGERLALADRIYDSDVTVKAAKETGWKKEGNEFVLEVADNATHADIEALLDKNPNVKPELEAPAAKATTTDEHAGDTKPAQEKDGTMSNSPIDAHETTPKTATNEVHKYRIHEDGTVTRCSDRCTLFLENAKGRSGDIQKIFGKEHPNTAKAKELHEKAKQLVKEAKKASAIKDKAEKQIKEQELLDRATQMELDLAVLEGAMISETNTRISKHMDEVKAFIDDHPEYQGVFEERINNRKERMKEIAPRLNDPDPVIKERAWKELENEERLSRELAVDMQKHAVNMSKPNISERYKYYETPPDAKGEHVKMVEGELGVPGEVMKHRSQTEQGKVSSGSGDDAGHLIGNTFGAAGDGRNLGKQNWIANEFGTWRQLEIMWAEKLVNGTKIKVKVREVAHARGERPYMREAVWTEIDPQGKVTEHSSTFGNFESVKSRTATGAAPTPGVPETGGTVFIWNNERSKRGLAPVYSKEELLKVTSFLQGESKAENDVFQAANDNDEL